MLEIDACDSGIGAVLMQGGHPLGPGSKEQGFISLGEGILSYFAGCRTIEVLFTVSRVCDQN